MIIKKYFLLYFILVLFLSCQGQRSSVILISDLEGAEQNKLIEMVNIIESKNGRGSNNLPDWVRAYIIGGTAEVERLERFNNRYCFIVRNEGTNFNALSIWTENYSAVRDFPRLVASRIEQRVIQGASMNPDDEFGLFYERFLKMAFDSEYPDVQQEDSFWVRLISNDFIEIYDFSVFLSVEKSVLQDFIIKMFADSLSDVHISRSQNSAVNRLKNNFFDGF